MPLLARRAATSSRNGCTSAFTSLRDPRTASARSSASSSSLASSSSAVRARWRFRPLPPDERPGLLQHDVLAGPQGPRLAPLGRDLVLEALEPLVQRLDVVGEAGDRRLEVVEGDLGGGQRGVHPGGGAVDHPVGPLDLARQLVERGGQLLHGHRDALVERHLVGRDRPQRQHHRPLDLPHPGVGGDLGAGRRRGPTPRRCAGGRRRWWAGSSRGRPRRRTARPLLLGRPPRRGSGRPRHGSRPTGRARSWAAASLPVTAAPEIRSGSVAVRMYVPPPAPAGRPHRPGLRAGRLHARRSSTASGGPAGAAVPAQIRIDGHGWGHGRGMGQFGALRLRGRPRLDRQPDPRPLLRRHRHLPDELEPQPAGAPHRPRRQEPRSCAHRRAACASRPTATAARGGPCGSSGSTTTRFQVYTGDSLRRPVAASGTARSRAPAIRAKPVRHEGRSRLHAAAEPRRRRHPLLPGRHASPSTRPGRSAPSTRWTPRRSSARSSPARCRRRGATSAAAGAERAAGPGGGGPLLRDRRRQPVGRASRPPATARPARCTRATASAGRRRRSVVPVEDARTDFATEATAKQIRRLPRRAGRPHRVLLLERRLHRRRGLPGRARRRRRHVASTRTTTGRSPSTASSRGRVLVRGPARPGQRAARRGVVPQRARLLRRPGARRCRALFDGGDFTVTGDDFRRMFGLKSNWFIIRST